MKKKLAIKLAIILIIIAIVIILIYMNNSKETIQDYTKYSDNEIFYSDISKVRQDLKYSYKLENQSVTNSIYIQCIDEDLKPIKEAKFEIYDTEGYIIMQANANESGIIAINNLENEKEYYFKQIETKNGLVIDDTLYTLKIDYKNDSFAQIIVNANRELAKEEKEEIFEKYNQSITNTDEIKTYKALSDKETEEKGTNNIIPQTYILLKDDLRGLKLKFTPTAETLSFEDERLEGYTVRVSNASVLEYEIETEDNEVNLINSKKEITNKFYNGEEFYIKTNEEHIGYTKYKFTIKLKYNDKIYKIYKEIYLNKEGLGLGRIELTAFKENSLEISPNEKIRLSSVVNTTNDKVTMMVAETGTDAKIQYYKVPVGKYIFTRLVNEEEVSSEVFEVKRNEITEVQFK